MTYYWPRRVGLIAEDGKCVQMVGVCGHDLIECLCPGPKRRVEVRRECPTCKNSRPFPPAPAIDRAPSAYARQDLSPATDAVAVRGIVGDPAE